MRRPWRPRLHPPYRHCCSCPGPVLTENLISECLRNELKHNDDDAARWTTSVVKVAEAPTCKRAHAYVSCISNGSRLSDALVSMVQPANFWKHDDSADRLHWA